MFTVVCNFDLYEEKKTKAALFIMVLFCAVFETVYGKCYQNITSRLDPKPQEVKRS